MGRADGGSRRVMADDAGAGRGPIGWGGGQMEARTEKPRRSGVESRSVGTRVTLREEHFSWPGLSIARGQCPIEDGLVLASSMHRS